jgi:hypothetical protein
VSILPPITPVTELGALFVEAYAKYAGLSVEAYLAQSGETLTAERVAERVVSLITDDEYGSPAYALTADGLRQIE